MKKNHKYSLILVACYIYSVSNFSTIQLIFINEYYLDFESYFICVTNFKLVCLLPIVAYTYVPLFLTHMLVDMKKLKCFLLIFL